MERLDGPQPLYVDALGLEAFRDRLDVGHPRRSPRGGSRCRQQGSAPGRRIPRSASRPLPTPARPARTPPPWRPSRSRPAATRGAMANRMPSSRPNTPAACAAAHLSHAVAEHHVGPHAPGWTTAPPARIRWRRARARKSRGPVELTLRSFRRPNITSSRLLPLASRKTASQRSSTARATDSFSYSAAPMPDHWLP